MQAEAISRSAAEPLQYRIRDGVARIERRGSIVLVSPEDGTSVRVSSAAGQLLPLLARGADLDQLTEKLRETHPRASGLTAKLNGFLQQLHRSGLLDDGERAPVRRHRAPRLKLFDPDPAAAAVSRAVLALPRWLSWCLLYAVLLAAAAGLLTLIWSGQLPHPRELVTQFNGWGLAIFVLLVLPLHESGHAIACRLAGAPVGEAGLMVHNWVVPGPYVETNQAYSIRDRRKRFWIPAAGPLVNLLTAGGAAWALVLLDAGHPASGLLTTLFFLAALFVYLDTNPLTPSDGSHMLEALLDDELARVSALSRKRARLSHPKTVAIYRIAASMHLQGSAVLMYFWWTS